MDGREKIFAEEVYSIVRQIPYGKVISYGTIASLAGYPGLSRMAGRAMHDAPADSGLPCHRVVNSAGRTVPYWPEQRTLLETEGVTFCRSGNVNMAKHLWKPEDEE